MNFQIIISLLLLKFFFEKSNISLNITDFASSKGNAMVLLLDQNENEVSNHILPIINKKVSYTFKLVNSSKYAVKVYHDENSNKKLDANILGIPKEKWGVSNNVEAKLGPPDFKKMLFEVKSDITIQIRLK